MPEHDRDCGDPAEQVQGGEARLGHCGLLAPSGRAALGVLPVTWEYK